MIAKPPPPQDYVFETDWFSHNLPSLNAIFNFLHPQKILEIGSYEGRSACYFIEKGLQHADEIEIHCIDTWEGGAEHKGVYDLQAVEQRFQHNLNIALNHFPDSKAMVYKG